MFQKTESFAVSSVAPEPRNKGGGKKSFQKFVILTSNMTLKYASQMDLTSTKKKKRANNTQETSQNRNLNVRHMLQTHGHVLFILQFSCYDVFFVLACFH